jgi:hypothetical protein
VDRQSHSPTAAAAPDQGAAPFTFEVGPFVEARKQAWDCIGTLRRTICALQPGQGQTEARPSDRCSMLRIRTTEQRIAREGNSRSNHVSRMNESAGSPAESKFLPGHRNSHILRRR